MKQKDTITYFQEAFREWITKNNLTQNQASELIGISPTLVNHLKNKKRNVTFKQADEIAERLNTSVFEMIARGRTLLGDDQHTTKLTREQILALDAFKFCLEMGGEAAEMLAKNAIELARKKQAEAEIQNPSKVISKSA